MRYYITKPQQLYLSLIFSFGMVSNTAHSSLPVIDVTALPSHMINSITNVVSEAEQAIQLGIQESEFAQQTLQYGLQGQQYARQALQLKQQYDAFSQQLIDFQNMVGNYDMGKLLDASADFATRRFAPPHWQSSINALRNGQYPSNFGEMRNLVETFKTTHQVSQGDYIYESTGGGGSIQGAFYDSSVASTMFTSAIADTVYSSSEERTDNIELLGDEIDKAHDQKAALDLSNRLLVQVLHQQNQLIQLI